MKGNYFICILIIMSVVVFTHPMKAQDTYFESFDNEMSWSGGSAGSYTPKYYENQDEPYEDQFNADEAVRESSNVVSGFAWRLRNSGNPFFIYECQEEILSFSVFLASWDVDVAISISIEYSNNNGASYTLLETMDETWWTSQGFSDKEYRQYFSGELGLVPLQGEKIYLKIISNGNERLLIDDFQLNYNNGSTGIQDPGSFLAETISESQIDLVFAPNNSNDDVVIAYNEDGSFDNPFGPPPSIGQPFAGGTLLYSGVESPQSHSGLLPSQEVHYMAWSYDGDTYSNGISGTATTLGSVVLPNAWINEIHYDNQGGDIDEFVEIILQNPGNIDMEDISLFLYNGSNGEIYASETGDNFSVGASVDDLSFYNWFYSGIQNGAPEGVALAYDGILIPGQFLSYEGSFLAMEGPASGMVSDDIGVQEPTSNPVGYSLQLGGSGQVYEHFEWQDPAEHTPGNVNFLQEFGNVTTWTGAVSSNWMLEENWDNGIPSVESKTFIPQIDVNSSYYPIIDVYTQISDLIISENALLEISSCGALTVNEMVNNEGSLILRSDDSGSGSLIEYSGTTALVERNLTPSQWHYVSLPVTTAFSDVFENLYLMEWNEPSESWNSIEELGIPLNSEMYGYSVWAENPSVVNFSGQLNTGDQFIGVTNTAGTSNPENDPSGYNLVGNPYPSSIDWDVNEGEGWTRTTTNVALAIYYWNGTQYASYVKDGPNPGPNGGSNIIPPHQGFFVKCISNDGGSISVSNNTRIHDNQIFYKNEDADERSIRMQVTGNQLKDELILNLNENSGFGFDHQFDAYKLFGTEEAPQLFSYASDSTMLSLNSFPFIVEKMTLAVGFIPGSGSGIFDLVLKELNGFDSIPIVLEDLKENILVNFKKEKGYKFIAEPNDDIHRFNVRFFPDDSPANQNLATCADTRLYVDNGKIHFISASQKRVKIMISDLQGRIVFSSGFTDLSDFEIETGHLYGFFVATIITENEMYSHKLFIPD